MKRHNSADERETRAAALHSLSPSLLPRLAALARLDYEAANTTRHTQAGRDWRLQGHCGEGRRGQQIAHNKAWNCVSLSLWGQGGQAGPGGEGPGGSSFFRWNLPRADNCGFRLSKVVYPLSEWYISCHNSWNQPNFLLDMICNRYNMKHNWASKVVPKMKLN